MSEIKVSFAQLDGAASTINATMSKLGQVLEQLDNDLQPLVAGWTGQAAADYQARKAQWRAAQTDMNTVLGRIGTAVTSASENYRAVERANAARWA
ncbi:MAG TPA: WXG100 family type VII secretion target [Pseudonocardia sp.]|jgi:early secretory antigenic target protein ESAT-6|nr:WXG100 family type VII secretion target [Pseudonocardia sp.]